jgi:hypothetical protein
MKKVIFILIIFINFLFELLITSVFFLAGSCSGMPEKEPYIYTWIFLEGDVTDSILIYGTCAHSDKFPYVYEKDMDCLALILEVQLAEDDW